jgi:phage-related baseplate assembly protein
MIDIAPAPHWTEKYRHAAMLAHEQVRAVHVDSPDQCVVHLKVTAWTPDGVPTAEILSAVKAAAESVATVAEQVQVE